MSANIRKLTDPGPHSPPKPMLAKLARELPRGEYAYEPKWDGFRCLAARNGDEIELRSRHGRPLARYFPEVVEALAALPRRRFTLDGELLLLEAHRFEFSVLMSRLHPAASRVERLARDAPATLVAFDLVALDDELLMDRSFRERRALLEGLLADREGRVVLTPMTREPAVAERWLRQPVGSGIDGVVAKEEGLPYRPGSRAMVKVKHERTLDCVAAGFRQFLDTGELASLLLGLYNDSGTLEHVGVASSFRADQRRILLAELAPHAVPLDRHPWRQGYLTGGGATGRLPGSAGRWTPEMELDWVPIAPRLVCEVAYDHVDGRRFRHSARFRRWRPDRSPASCTFEQLGPT